ncbi:MAG: hypothetical protein PW786_04485 [Arachidicoccus sp.]|nr:hypothetical protein [Arachidicoccus sp.]
MNINILKTFFCTVIFLVIINGCTKNGVNGDVSATGIQLLNFYKSDKTYSLILGSKDTVISGIGFNGISKTASGSPGFYSISVQDNTNHQLLSGNINLLAGTQYSLFIVRDSAESADSAQYTLVADNTIQQLPQYDSCRIRILDFARNLTYTDLRFNINEGTGYGLPSPYFQSTFINSRTYLDNNTYPVRSQYFTVPAISYKVRFLNGSDTTQKILDSTYITFDKQKKYTFLLLGKYNSQDANDPFRYQIISQ